LLGIGKLSYSQIHGVAQVLSVDDGEVNQLVIEEILTAAGYVVVR
jgi:hypothetical protein